MKVAYNLGPHRRSFTGTVVGDAGGFYPGPSAVLGASLGYRRMFRDMVNSFAGYDLQPMCLVLDADQLDPNATFKGMNRGSVVMYCRFSGTLSLADEGWDNVQSTASNYQYRFGNMSVSFEEEL